MNPRKCSALIGFYGDDLNPEEISSLLGCAPSVGVKKGETWRPTVAAVKVASTGSWRLKADYEDPRDLEEKILGLFAKMSNDLNIWRTLTTRFRGVVFCGLFLHTVNAGVVFSPATLASIGDRRLTLDLDIWADDLIDE